MSALETRAGVHAGRDFYLCPLSAVQVPPALLAQYLTEAQASGPPVAVERTRANGTVELIADAYERTETLTAVVEGWSYTWVERRVLVRSHAQARSKETALRRRLAQAQAALADLLVRRRGKARIADASTAQQLVTHILARFDVAELLRVSVTEQIEQQRVRADRERPAHLRERRNLTLTHAIDTVALSAAIAQLGWRVYVTNQPVEQLATAQVVLAYREEYLVERSLGRLKGQPLSLTPL